MDTLSEIKIGDLHPAEGDDEKAQPYRMGVPLRYSTTLANKVFIIRQQICKTLF